MCTISGFTKTEGNSVAVRVDDEVVILDMGLGMENYIQYSEDRDDVSAKTYEQLLKVGAVPNYKFISDWKEKVIAIVPSHGHLDHVGAVPFGAPLFPLAPIICTPYTAEILKSIMWDEDIKIPNRIIPLNSNSSYKLTETITIEFVHVTHSIPHTVLVVLHTPYGKVMYANDYKFDRQPVLGKKPNFKRIEELGKEGIKLLIVDCLYAHERRKMPSESVARQMLRDVLLSVNTEDKAIVVTTFSSHLARLSSVIELGQKLNRKVVFIGRSLLKYVKAAERINLVDFQKDVTIVRHREKVNKLLAKIKREGKGKYIVVCTGNQGEPRAVLSRIARGELDFKFESGDIVVFSCSVIPVPINQGNRAKLEKILSGNGIRIFRDVHASGHAALEDHRDMFELAKPEHIMPIHAEPAKAQMLADFAVSLGFKKNHVMEDGQRLSL